MYRNLANNHLESPLPSFLQTNPAIDSLDLRNNSFVREIRSQRSGTYHSLNSHLTHARRRARSRLGVTTSLEVVSVSLVLADLAVTILSKMGNHRAGVQRIWSGGSNSCWRCDWRVPMEETLDHRGKQNARG